MASAAGWVALIATCVAAIMTASNLGARVTGWGFVVFAVGAVGWIVVGISSGQRQLLYSNIFLGVVDLIGVWRWLGVRPARFSDVEAMVALIETRRDDYQVMAPLFWKKSANSAQWSRRYYRFLLLMRRATVLVAESGSSVEGFLIATRARVSPVFNPGSTVFVDDFYVIAPDRWADVGAALVDYLRQVALDRGWQQLIIVSGTKDAPKNAFLASAGLAATSSWWTGQA